jgi:hypothetical protein
MTTKKQVEAWKHKHPKGPFGFAFTWEQLDELRKAHPDANGARVVFGLNKEGQTAYLEPANLPVSKSIDGKPGGGGLPCPTYCS